MGQRGLLERLVRYRPKEGGDSKEDFLTETWAHLLAADPALLLDVVERVFGPAAREEGARGPTSVDTQVNMGPSPIGGPNCILDLVIRASGHSYIFEHKIDSPLGQTSGENDVVLGQLQRYLALRKGPVALVSRREIGLPSRVVGDPSYCRPGDRHHFAWWDMRDLIERRVEAGGDTYLHREVMLLMSVMGLDRPPAPDPHCGDLGFANEKETADNRDNFKKLLDGVKATFEKQGWVLTYNSWDLLFKRPDDPDVTIYFSGRWEGRHDLVLRLRLPLERVPNIAALGAEVEVRVPQGLVLDARRDKTTTDLDVAEVIISTGRAAWLEGYAQQGAAAVGQRLAQFVDAALAPLGVALGAAHRTTAPRGQIEPPSSPEMLPMDMCDTYPDSQFKNLTRSTIPLLAYWKDAPARLALLAERLGADDLLAAIITPEFPTASPGGKASFTDLLVESSATAVAIEGKYTEGRYETVGRWRGDSENRRRVLEHWLSHIRRRAPCPPGMDVDNLVYQMIHRTASACARPAEKAIVLYEVFSDAHVAEYEADLRALAEAIKPGPMLQLWLQVVPTSEAAACADLRRALAALPDSAHPAKIREALSTQELFSFGESRFERIG